MVFNKRIEFRRLKQGEVAAKGLALVGIEHMEVDTKNKNEMEMMRQEIAELERQKYENLNKRDSPQVVRRIEMKKGGLVRQSKQVVPLSPRSGGGGSPR